MGVRVVPSYLPDPGATFSQADIHRIIDDATVEGIDIGSIDTSSFNIMDQPTAYSLSAARPAIQKLHENGVVVHASGASMAGIGIGSFLSRGGGAYWDRGYGTAGVNVPKGWPVFLAWCSPNWSAYQAWPGHTVAAEWRMPRVTADVNYIYPNWTSNLGGGRGIKAHDGVMITTEEYTSSPHLGGICYHGFCEALVHYSLSDSFQPNDLYCLYHSDNAIGSARKTRLPISWSGSWVSGATYSALPYGVIRQVYTDSGVTTVTMPTETDGYAPGAHPFYVAKIWFWGCPCL